MSTPFYDLASLVVVPSGYKASKVYAQKPLTTDGQLTFSRASTATRVNASGLIETIASNVPRLDYLGSSCPRLLLEPQATALNQYSESFNNAYWQKQNVILTNNAVTSPDGTQNAETITITTTNGEHNVFNLSAITITANANFTASGFVKNISGRYFSMVTYFGGVGFGPYATFDLTTGTLAQSGAAFGTYVSSSITNYGNGWYRISVTGQGNYTSLIIALDARSAASLAPGFQFSGTNEQYAIWGANLTQSSYATSYIPTLGAAVTRGADAAYKTGISSLIGQTEGTLFLEANVNVTGNASNFAGIAINDGTSSNTMGFGYYQEGRIQAAAFAGGSIVVNINLPFFGLTSGSHKFALAYKLNDYVFYVDGVQVGSDTSAAVPATSVLNLSDLVGGDISHSQALVFKTRLTNAQLAELTTL
jgi:hypothetical protein